MKKYLKVILIVVGILVLIGIGVFLYFNLTYISKDQVRENIASQMNVDVSDLHFSSIDLEMDENVYEAEVYYQNREYEFKIDARDGDLVYTNYVKSNNSVNNENNNSNNEINTNDELTIDEAKALVLKENNLSESDVVFSKPESDYDNNMLIYDIEFIYNNTEYNYEVRASDGQIISFEQDSVH